MTRFSILTPIFETDEAALGACLESVLNQTSDNWELCLVDDGSRNPKIKRILDDVAADPRVRIRSRATNGGIVAASNDALDMATGEFVVLLDHDDTLALDALYELEQFIRANDDVDYLYSDEDHIDLSGARVMPFFKPDWSPERFRSQNYTCHLSALRRTLVQNVGGFREGFDGSQDYDLFLRVIEKARRVVHVPKILYHWRMSATSEAANPGVKPAAVVAAQRALADHCARVGIDASVDVDAKWGTFRVRRIVQEHPLVSVVIPTRGSRADVFGLPRCFVVECVRSIVQRSTYKNVEVIAVCDDTTPGEVLAELRSIAGEQLTIVPYRKPFNFAEKIDLGVVWSSGEYVILLNDDIEVITPDWIESMLGLAMQDDVGMVGAKLLYPDGTLQHAGHLYVGNPTHAFYRRGNEESGPGRLLHVDREVSGVTAACALVRRAVFDEVGGLTLHLPANFNDVDFSLKIRRQGYRILWTPHAVLYHFESKTRDPRVEQFEVDFVHRRWHHELLHDPYHNPNLELGRDDWLPRATRIQADDRLPSILVAMSASSSAPTSPCLSVVMPCYNERGTIREVVKAVLDSPYVGELIIVDDGSSDGTREILTEFVDPRVRVLLQPVNQGKGAALRRGFQAATQPFVIVQDADLEYDPGEFGDLLRPLLDGRADVVYGSRFLSGRPHRVLYYWHSMGNKFLTTVSNMATDLNLTDMETCYKAFRREVIQSIEIEEDRFGFEPEITAKLAAGGWRIYEVGISYTGRTYDEGKKIGWRDGMRAIYCIGRYSRPGRRIAESQRARQATKAKGGREGKPTGFHEADEQLAETLDNLDGADNYADWITSLIEPYVGGEILEVGAGHGTFVDRLAGFGHVTATDLSERAVAEMRARFAGRRDVDVLHAEALDAVRDRSFDTIVMLNVLEHLADDLTALKRLGAALNRGGHLIVFTPAFESLYSEFDRKVGHFRRYRKDDVGRLMIASGLEIATCQYVNAVGAVAWALWSTWLGKVPTDKGPVSLFDRVGVPLVRRIERGRKPPFGQSVLCVGRKP